MMRHILVLFCLQAVLVIGCSNPGDPSPEPTAPSETPPQSGEDTPSRVNSNNSAGIFEERILPIFQSPNPSSCAECHLSGVDLKDYIRPRESETFAALLDAGLIDTKNPDDSKILQFINRRPKQPNLITDKVRQEEYQAFREWIHTAVQNPDLLVAKFDDSIGPQVPAEVIRHARRDRVLASFMENIWTEVGRCAACHSPDRNQKQVREYGEQVSWIKLRDPQATLNYMVENNLINPRDPQKSLLLLKPTMQVEHGGGQKMVVGDRSYKQFRRFIDDYAAMVQGKYDAVSDLPQPEGEVSVVTDIWLKITGVPAQYDKMLLQADVYRWTNEGWSKLRVATSDRLVFGPKNLWQHSLSLTAPRDSQWAKEINAKRLPPGRYLVKLYMDRTKKLEKDYRAVLGEEDFVGEAEVQSRWPAGYSRMTIVKFPSQ
ncbi:MAG: hypothetical protein KDA84_24010 [Planctomycetaceae bacterium]|nr:hypothetical protein [Planctomycetaceae bacterium]